MTPHPSVPAWEIPWTEEPDRLQSTCATLLQSSLTLATLWTVAGRAPLSMGFPRQEHWGGCHFLLSGIETASLKSPALTGRFFTPSATWEALGYKPLGLQKNWTLSHLNNNKMPSRCVFIHVQLLGEPGSSPMSFWSSFSKLFPL